MNATSREPVRVAPSWAWTGVRTVEAFAAERGVRSVRVGDLWLVGGGRYRVGVVYRGREPRCAVFEAETEASR